MSFACSSARTIRRATSCVLLRFSPIITIGIVCDSCLSYSRVISGTGSLSMSLLSSLVSGSSILGVYGLSLNTGDWKMLLFYYPPSFFYSLIVYINRDQLVPLELKLVTTRTYLNLLLNCTFNSSYSPYESRIP